MTDPMKAKSAKEIIDELPEQVRRVVKEIIRLENKNSHLAKPHLKEEIYKAIAEAIP